MFQVESIETPLGQATLVRVRGEIDIASAGALASVLGAAKYGARRIIVSLEDCRYCDSTGLAVCVGMSSGAGPRPTFIVGPGTQVDRLFRLTRMDERLAVYDSLAAAVAAEREPDFMSDGPAEAAT